MYMCFGTNCPRPNKRWPGLDNLKQHLNRMRHEEDGDVLLKKYMDWYEMVILPQPEQSFDERSSRDESVLEAQDGAPVQSTADFGPEYGSMPQQRTDNSTFGAATPRLPQHGTPSLAGSTSKFSASGSLGLATSQDSSAERDDPKFAFPAARLVGLYRRLWESCVAKHFDGQKLEQSNQNLKEAGMHLRKRETDFSFATTSS
ncbi:unnamed protein product [Penicillium palitans]